jgi:hypothetical protein
MMKAELSQQLMITVKNKVGTLAEITRLIASAGINLVAVCAYTIDNKGFVNFVTEDNKQAKRVLEEKGYEIREEDVVLVSLGNKPGALQAVCDKIADAEIDLDLIYGTVEKGQKTSQVVFVSEDDQAVLTVVRTIK